MFALFTELNCLLYCGVTKNEGKIVGFLDFPKL
jgi:hypothetical protein